MINFVGNPFPTSRSPTDSIFFPPGTSEAQGMAWIKAMLTNSTQTAFCKPAKKSSALATRHQDE